VTQHAGYNTQIKNLWSSFWKMREAFVINKRDLSFNQFLTYWIFQIYKTSQPSVRIWNPSSIKICQNLVLLKANKFDLAKNHRVAMTNVYTHGSKDFATPCSHWTNAKKLLLINCTTSAALQLRYVRNCNPETTLSPIIWSRSWKCFFTFIFIP
jgi:hypothetical protein